MKRHWMGGERKLIKKKKDLKIEFQRVKFEQYKEENEEPLYKKIATQDVMALLGSFDINEIQSNLGENEIMIYDSFLNDENIFENEMKSISSEKTIEEYPIEEILLSEQMNEKNIYNNYTTYNTFNKSDNVNNDNHEKEYSEEMILEEQDFMFN